MTQTPDPVRRSLIQSVAAGMAVSMAGASTASTAPPAARGRPGDFDFLAGEWRIQHRRLRDGVWDEFDGEASCWTILGGVGSVEELRIPAREFSGLGLRLLDVERGLWLDYWVNAKSGVLGSSGVTGHFIEGAGVFIEADRDGATPILVRGLWDRITSDSCRWSQSTSRDGGTTWVDNWLMEWRRVRAP